MLRKSSDIIGYMVNGKDGELGRLSDLHFDDQRWTVRYFAIDGGSHIDGRRVYLSPGAAGEPDTQARVLPASLSREEVRESPEIEPDARLSRGDEMRISAHFGWPAYWADAPELTGIIGGHVEAVAQRTGESAPGYARRIPGLRRASELTGFRVFASDGEVGDVTDCVVGTEDWVVRYLIVDVSAIGQSVLLPPDRISQAEWENRDLTFALVRSTVETSPAGSSLRVGR